MDNQIHSYHFYYIVFITAAFWAENLILIINTSNNERSTTPI